MLSKFQIVWVIDMYNIYQLSWRCLSVEKEKFPTYHKLTHRSYYQVHTIQPITKRHVLPLDFAITTHKPMEICQVSCKNQSRISARVSDDTSSLARVSDDTSNPTRVSDDISGPIRLWHVSPIRLRHVSLTHPQTPINRSLPKAFQKI